jgi:RND family efflux transporter MFP subunit
VTAVVAAATGMFVGTRIGRRAGRTTSASAAASAMPGMDMSAPPRPLGAGDKAVYVSPARQQLVGVRTGLVERQHVAGTITTVGTLAYDETRVAEVHARVSGWVEQLYVDYVGKPVRRGQPLFSIYSPDLVTAQSDYLLARRMQRETPAGPVPEAKAGADALLEASRDRLKRWDVSDAEIAALEKSGQATRTLILSSPFDGVVLAKAAFAGQYITPEMTAFRLADLSSIWVIGQMFEFEAARIHPGDDIDVDFPYSQASSRKAKVDFIYPEVDPKTRRLRFRATLKNADGKLKPDTYVTLVWHGDAVDRLALPKEALIDNGDRKYVLLALADGYFDPRTVKVGPASGDFYPVIAGVAEGDRVVTSAQFLIDSETNLLAAMQSMSAGMPGMDMGPKKQAPPASASSTAVAPVAPSAVTSHPAPPKPTAPRPAPATSDPPRGASSASMPPMPGMP